MNKKTSYTIKNINNHLITCSPAHLLTFDKMLTIVTKYTQNRQFSLPTCFIIHVGLDRIGEKTYA